MKIAVNTRFLLKDQLEGIGVFTHETMQRITRNFPDNEFIFIFDRPYDEAFIYNDNITPEVVYPPARHPILWYWWFEWSIPRILKKHQPDIFLSPDGYLSLRSNFKAVPVIHDLAFEHYPNDVPWTTRKYYHYFFPRYAKKATRIATVSSYSRQDLVDRYAINQDKIDVVYNGGNKYFKPLTAQKRNEVKQSLTGGHEFFAYVGSLHQRKNIDNLLKAFDLFKDQTESDLKLVLIGRKAWSTEKLEHTYEQMKHRDEVIFTGSLTSSDLSTCLASAYALTYVSYFEGFGIPLIEAMNCNVPVITSDRSSLPEVAGDAGLIVDPFSPEAIADSMQKLWERPRLRADLIEKGKIQREVFSWDRTADLLWQTVLKAL